MQVLLLSLRERVGPPRVDAGAADGSELVVGEGVAEVALVRVVEHPRHLVPTRAKVSYVQRVSYRLREYSLQRIHATFGLQPSPRGHSHLMTKF